MACILITLYPEEFQVVKIKPPVVKEKDCGFEARFGGCSQLE